MPQIATQDSSILKLKHTHKKIYQIQSQAKNLLGRLKQGFCFFYKQQSYLSLKYHVWMVAHSGITRSQNFNSLTRASGEFLVVLPCLHKKHDQLGQHIKKTSLLEVQKALTILRDEMTPAWRREQASRTQLWEDSETSPNHVCLRQ